MLGLTPRGMFVGMTHISSLSRFVLFPMVMFDRRRSDVCLVINTLLYGYFDCITLVADNDFCDFEIF